MIIKEQNIRKILLALLIVSLSLRAFFAAFLELGNDEVYYWTYALYPDWSHFDHPGMLGWMMQIFSLNLLFDSEFFLRLSSVLLMTVDTYLFYLIGCKIKNKMTGLYAALLYSASLYGFVITGVFIMPDTPLMFFSLLSIYLLISYFKSEKRKSWPLLLAGFTMGCAMLSKYSAAFMWLGLGLYILCFDRKELKNKYLYLSFLISAVCILPILIWNVQNDFISFNFHSDRVSWFDKLRLDYFGRELFGEFLYNNPIVYVLIIIALVSFFRKKYGFEKSASLFLLCITLPWVGLFWYFSLTRPTLPHWSAPAVSFLILFAAAFLEAKSAEDGKTHQFPKTIIVALSLLLITISVGTFEIKTGTIQAFMNKDKNQPMNELGRGDVTLDMYGWKQLEKKFAVVRAEAILQGKMQESDGIVALQWFPAANLDYYVARPLNIPLIALGDLSQIHKYQWINKKRGDLRKNATYWFLDQSCHSFGNDHPWLQESFSQVEPIDTIAIERSGRTVEYVFVYKLYPRE